VKQRSLQQVEHAERGSRYLTDAIAAFESAGPPYDWAVDPLLHLKQDVLHELHGTGSTDRTCRRPAPDSAKE
jgi:hypothetical protein